jgi:hypothetical protein
MMLGVMDFHRARVNVGFEGVRCIRQCGKRVGHGVGSFVLETAVIADRSEFAGQNVAPAAASFVVAFEKL